MSPTLFLTLKATCGATVMNRKISQSQLIKPGRKLFHVCITVFGSIGLVLHSGESSEYHIFDIKSFDTNN
jgi:hypothetical protein